MRLKKRKIRHDLKALRKRERRGVEGWVNLRQRDRGIYEPVTQHYSVMTSWTIINMANEHSRDML